MDYRISNVKVSLKTSPISLNSVFSECTKNCKNFIVLKKKYTYVIFKTNKESVNHVNIKKIPSLDKVFDLIEYLRNFFDFKVIKLSIDNIIASLKLSHCIDLVSICEKKLFQSMKYNNEKFPGLFVKFKEGTAILFHSGKVVLVGCKNEENLKCLTTNIYVAMKQL